MLNYSDWDFKRMNFLIIQLVHIMDKSESTVKINGSELSHIVWIVSLSCQEGGITKKKNFKFMGLSVLTASIVERL